MNILINCSNLKIGGGLQVADSICRFLNRYKTDDFVVVLSTKMDTTYQIIKNYSNVKVYIYDIKNSISTLVFGCDNFLDNLVSIYGIETAITIFGPSRWIPKCPHLCGFARPHLVLSQSPYFNNFGFIKKIKMKLYYKILEFYFKRGSTNLYTENEYISKKLRELIKKVNIYTVTNYYNQIFDDASKWIECKLPSFEGTTLLTISAPYAHKNLTIIKEIIRLIHEKEPELKLRFVLTIDEKDYPKIPNELKKYFLFIGKVGIAECPSLYHQADIMFMPSLLECFTATYPEAMRMQVPIVTTDLDFAHGLCSNAALYYSPLDAKDAVNCIYRLIKEDGLREQLIENGKKQLKNFDNNTQRADKLIKIAKENALNTKNKEIKNIKIKKECQFSKTKLS